MKYAHQYLLSAIQIMHLYDGSMPLAAHLKKHFSENKKFGSKDRKNITHLCYCYCRIGNAGKLLPKEDQFKTALFLVNESADGWDSMFDEKWLQQWSASIETKFNFIKSVLPAFEPNLIFPCLNELSNKIEPTAFSNSHLVQPEVFLRIRPGKYEAVRKQLKAANIPFTEISDTCFSFPQSVKIEEVITLDRDAVIQDRSSQGISKLISRVEVDKTKAIQLWDCCAASGGKTILAKDSLGVMDITVSDIRSSILHNLKSRFERAGIKYFKSFTSDLSKKDAQKPTDKFDLILADVPCSGSGTWGRTPEQLLFFTADKLNHYSQLQKSIAQNVLSSIAPNGYLLYSTCSVFKAENEDIVSFILQLDSTLKIVEERYLQGYTLKADSMYAVLFQKA